MTGNLLYMLLFCHSFVIFNDCLIKLTFFQCLKDSYVFKRTLKDLYSIYVSINLYLL